MSEGIQVNCLDFPGLLGREWLCTNSLGGYALSTVPCLNTRKYHGLLVAALAPPGRRMILLSRVEEHLKADGHIYPLGCAEYPGAIHPLGHQHLRAFNHNPFPRWAYQTPAGTVEKSLRLLKGANTVVLTYTLLTGGQSIGLDIRPLLALRPIHELMQQWNGRIEVEPRSDRQLRILPTARTPELFLACSGSFEPGADWYLNHVYRREFERGYAGMEDLWSPGTVKLTLAPGQPMHLICSTEPIDADYVLEKADWQCSSADYVIVSSHLGPTRPIIPPSPDPTFDALLSAAGQFILGSPGIATAANTAPEKTVACVSNYPWGAISHRVALTAFTGLFLSSGRYGDARSLLLSLAPDAVRGTLAANASEEGEPLSPGGADVSLWFVNAVYNYFRHTCDVGTLRRGLLEAAIGVIDRHLRGADPNAFLDSESLLCTRPGADPATWMDAHTGDWTLTPRSGRPVELNALWHNALCISAELGERYGTSDRAPELASIAHRVREAFNRRFWNDSADCCFDVVMDDGVDASIRPNQLLAMSLPYPVLSLDRHAQVLEQVRDKLLTPRGVRTLAPASPKYVSRYEGNITSRERAIHGGCAHPWLLGHYTAALLRLNGRSARQQARAVLEPVLAYLHADGLGQICELFDGDSPQRPGGAIASALSVGEILRAYAEDVLDLGPAVPFPVGLAINAPAPSPRPPAKAPH